MKEQCGSCRYFREEIEDRGDGLLIGECRRFPPLRMADIPDDKEPRDPYWYGQPWVYDCGWCGEYKKSSE